MQPDSFIGELLVALSRTSSAFGGSAGDYGPERRAGLSSLVADHLRRREKRRSAKPARKVVDLQKSGEPATERSEVGRPRHTGRDLSGQDLSNTNLEQAQMANAKLREVNLEGANLRGANLNESDLWRARLRRADLTAATFVNASLLQADLSGVDARGANFAGANLTDAELDGVTWDSHTQWPPEVVDELRAQSAEIAPGAYEVRQDPQELGMSAKRKV